MIDLLLLATMLLVCGGIGLPLALVLPQRFAWRVLIAPTLGTSVLAVAAPIAYRADVTIVELFWAAVTLAVICVVLTAWVIRRSRELVVDDRRLVGVLVGVCALAAVVLLAPRWVGGDQFSVFQGNQWDTFGYLESAVVYARKPFSIVGTVTDEQLMRNPMFAVANGMLNARPSVHQLYAVFSRVAPGEAYRLYYPFLVFSFVQLAQVTMFVLRNAFPATSRAAWCAIAFVFPLGFWGQYVFDINAWSQIAAQPVLFLIFGLTIHTLARPESKLRPALRIAGVLAIAVAGAAYLYPEGLVIYSAALGPVAAVTIAVRVVRARALVLAELVPLAGFAGVASVVLYAPQLAFVIQQMKWGSGTKVAWWQFFQAFFYGRDAYVSHGFARAGDFIAGLFGLYFATPAKGAGLVLGLLHRVVILATVLGLFGGIAALLAGKSSRAEREARVHLALWVVVGLVMLMPALRLALDENYWPAGKIVSFAAPVFMTSLCIAAGFAFDRPFRWVRGVAIGFVAFQLALGLMRIGAARRPNGMHYALPYPTVQAIELKRDLPWKLEPLESLSPTTKVLLRPMDVWAQGYLMAFLYARGIPFAIDGKINTYFGSGRDLPGLPPPWTPDAEITVVDRTIVVTFFDGRPALLSN